MNKVHVKIILFSPVWPTLRFPCQTACSPAERLQFRPLRLAFVARIFDADPHPAIALVVGKITHDLDTRMSSATTLNMCLGKARLRISSTLPLTREPALVMLEADRIARVAQSPP